MSSDWYTLLSLSMRYWFAAVITVVVWQAWRGAIHDSRNARKLRTEAPVTGAIGEFIVLEGGGKNLRTGTRVPVPREGLAGSSRRADVRLQHDDVYRYHARLEIRENGLLTETMGGAVITLGGTSGTRLLLRNGDVFSIGRLKLMLIMYDAAGMPMLDPTDEELFGAPAPTFRAPAKGNTKKKAGTKGGNKKATAAKDDISDLFETDAFKKQKRSGKTSVQNAKGGKSSRTTGRKSGKISPPFED